MRACAELTLYPFSEDYKSIIKSTVAQLQSLSGVEVTTYRTCTTLVGDYDAVMAAVKEIIAWSYENHGRCAFVAKILPGYVPG